MPFRPIELNAADARHIRAYVGGYVGGFHVSEPLHVVGRAVLRRLRRQRHKGKAQVPRKDTRGDAQRRRRLAAEAVIFARNAHRENRALFLRVARGI